MIQVLSRKAIQFRNPNAVLVNPKAKLGESDQVKTATKLEEAFCRIIPNVVTPVPDWVKTDPIFGWCVQDGSLMEIVTQPNVAVNDLQAAGQQQIAEADKAVQDQKAIQEKEALHEKLAKMTKQDLIDYAFENHDMELSSAMRKEDIVEAIKKAMEEASAEVK
jgi:hypothetical protein